MALPRIMESNDLLKFRTRVCQRWMKGNKCNFGDKCQYSHDLIWPRRPLWEINYTETLCSFTAEDSEQCPFARNCPNSHTEVEALYHPNVYKSKLCREFNRTGKCARYYCPYAHGAGELRTPQHGAKSKTSEELSPLSESAESEARKPASPMQASEPSTEPCTSERGACSSEESSARSGVETRGVVYVHRANMQFRQAEPAPRGLPCVAQVVHPSCSPEVLWHLYELFDEPRPWTYSVRAGFPLMDAWQMVLAVNRVLHVAETNNAVSVDLWKQYLEGSLLAFVAPERVAFWNHATLGTAAAAAPDDLKALTWSAFLLLYISQYGVHPFAPNASCVLYLLREGRPDVALSEKDRAQVFAAFAERAPVSRCAPPLVRGLEMRASQRGTWRQILAAYNSSPRFSPHPHDEPVASKAFCARGAAAQTSALDRALTRTSTGEESDFVHLAEPARPTHSPLRSPSPTTR